MRPTSPRQIQAKGEQDFRLLADLLGVTLTGDFRTDRAAVDRVLAGGSAGSGLMLGEHPPGRASTLDEIVMRYQNGELSNEYELQEATTAPTLDWFDEEGVERYKCDGFHSGGSAYEFTNLWYHLFGEELSLLGTPDWNIAHGGLRWEHHPGPVDHAGVEAAMDRAYARYQEAHGALVSGYVPVVPEAEDVPEVEDEVEVDFTTDDLWAMLDDAPAEEPATDGDDIDGEASAATPRPRP